MSEGLLAIGIIMLLIILPIMCVLQVLLCRLKSGFPGLILPLLLLYPGFVFSIFAMTGAFYLPLMMFVLPEIILLSIYFYIRRKPKLPTSDELRNMRAQDL